MSLLAQYDQLGAAPCDLLALDIDGTLVDGSHQPSPGAIAAVQALAAQGVQIVLATGRQLHGAAPVVAALGLAETWIVASDGAIVARFSDGDTQLFAEHMFEPGSLARTLLALDPEVRVGCEEVGIGYVVNRPFDVLLDPSDQQRTVPEFPTAITMLTATSTRLTGAELAGAARAEGLSCTGWDEFGCGCVDVNATGLSKATGVAQAARAAGSAARGIVAVGDFHNDIELLRWAHVGIAMGQSPPEVLAAADLVTAPIDADGVVDVLDMLLARHAAVG